MPAPANAQATNRTPNAAPAKGPQPSTTASSPAAPPKKPATAPSRLAAVKKGKLQSAFRYLFYGTEGVGKSSLASDAPSPLFIDIEGGADQLDVARYPFRDEPGGHVPQSYNEVLAALDDLIAHPAHGFQTIVIDTLDALEVLIHKHVLELHGKASIEDFPFKAGFQVALDEFRRLVVKLDAVKNQGVTVVLLGHSFVKPFKSPDSEDYDRYQLRVHEKIAGLAKSRCDVVGFVQFEGGGARLKVDGATSKRARGWMSGRRIVNTAPEAAWDAKTRLALPAVIELGVEHPWAPFVDAKELPPIGELIVAELDRIGAEQFTTANGRATSRAEVLQLVKTSDESVLTRVLNGLRATEAANDAAATSSQEGQ